VKRNNLTGDGRADVVVTSPWGLGMLAVENGTFVERMIAQNGTRFGQWLLNTSDNNVVLRADIDGDGVGELLMSSPWGIGWLKMIEGKLQSVAMCQNGHRIGEWVVDTTNNSYRHAGNFTGDGTDEVLAPNGTRFGAWLLNTADNSFPVLADLDGDGRQELVVTSPWGLGVLKLDGTQLKSIVMVPNGTSLGAWTLDTSKDRVELGADFNGDGRAELLLRNDTGMAILRLDGDSLRTVAAAVTEQKIGDWHFDATRDRLGVAGDFDGDGQVEILVAGVAGIALLTPVNGAFHCKMYAPNGSLFGGWLLNTRDNRLNVAFDFDADGRSELMISSEWGVGVLKFNGQTFDALAMAPNGTMIDHWLLNTDENDLEAGAGTSRALLIWHPHWTSAVSNTGRFLRTRGYDITATENAQEGLAQLRSLALTARAGDRVFVYLAAHGATGRTPGDRSRRSALTHWFAFGNGSLTLADLAPLFRQLTAAGADLIVFDGSCDGGESVIAALGERYLALSTTGAQSAGSTNTPDPSQMMQRFGKPSGFGLWWSDSPLASLMSSQTRQTLPEKIYRNDATEINELSLFYRPAIDFYIFIANLWNMYDNHRCDLFRYIFPDVYAGLDAADKQSLTKDADSYLRDVRAEMEAYAPSITRLQAILADNKLIARAADVYADAFPKPWQALFGDMDWDVNAEPTRVFRAPSFGEFEPRLYAGKAGFRLLIGDIQRILPLLRQSYEEKEQLLRQIDIHVAQSALIRPIATPIRPLRATTIEEYAKLNEFRERVDVGLQPTEQMLAMPERIVMKMRKLPLRSLHSAELQSVLLDEWREIQRPRLAPRFGDIVDDAVARIQELNISDGILIYRLMYILTVAEEAISRASSMSTEPGELVSF
jgi:hypothetical protein